MGSKKKTRKRTPKKGRGRPPKPEGERLSVMVNVRLDSQLAEFVDEHLAHLRATQPAASWSRGSAIRSLLHMARGHLAEAKAKPTRPGRRTR